MNVNLKQEANILIAAPQGELDHHTAKAVREKIDKTISDLLVKHLIFDFSEVDFMDSAGIGVVMGRYNKIAEIGGKVGITGCSPSIARILSMAGIFTIIEKYENTESAIKSM